MRKVDRSSWPPGPWDGEPLDRLEFEHAGFPCLLNRGPQGAWCGYVAVPPGHPAAVTDYDSDIEVHVHGGLTYGGGPPGSGDPPVGKEPLWLGFDCNHSGDVAPRNIRTDFRNEMYRTMEYAKRETESLAEQLREMATWGLPCSYKTMIEHMTGARSRAEEKRTRDGQAHQADG